MTTANMKLVILDVPLDDEMEMPDQNLEEGESIVRRAVEVKNLYRVLKGMLYSLEVPQSPLASFDLIDDSFPHGRKNIMKRRSENKTKFPLSAYERIFFPFGIGPYRRREAAAPRCWLRPGRAPENGCHGFIRRRI
jgi:hypothetical protein